MNRWPCSSGFNRSAALNGGQHADRPTERERVALLRSAGRGASRTLALQLLPDGGLVRSTRLARLEAALLISEGAVAPKKLVQLARLIDVKEVQQLVSILNESYDRTRSAFRIEQTAQG